MTKDNELNPARNPGKEVASRNKIIIGIDSGSGAIKSGYISLNQDTGEWTELDYTPDQRVAIKLGQDLEGQELIREIEDSRQIQDAYDRNNNPQNICEVFRPGIATGYGLEFGGLSSAGAREHLESRYSNKFSSSVKEKYLDYISSIVKGIKEQYPNQEVEVHLVGTASLRKADDAQYLVRALDKKLKEEFGVKTNINIISQRDEGIYAFEGAVEKAKVDRKKVTVFDAGGGSMQFTGEEAEEHKVLGLAIGSSPYYKMVADLLGKSQDSSIYPLSSEDIAKAIELGKREVGFDSDQEEWLHKRVTEKQIIGAGNINDSLVRIMKHNKILKLEDDTYTSKNLDQLISLFANKNSQQIQSLITERDQAFLENILTNMLLFKATMEKHGIEEVKVVQVSNTDTVLRKAVEANLSRTNPVTQVRQLPMQNQIHTENADLQIGHSGDSHSAIEAAGGINLQHWVQSAVDGMKFLQYMWPGKFGKREAPSVSIQLDPKVEAVLERDQKEKEYKKKEAEFKEKFGIEGATKDPDYKEISEKFHRNVQRVADQSSNMSAWSDISDASDKGRTPKKESDKKEIDMSSLLDALPDTDAQKTRSKVSIAASVAEGSERDASIAAAKSEAKDMETLPNSFGGSHRNLDADSKKKEEEVSQKEVSSSAAQGEDKGTEASPKSVAASFKSSDADEKENKLGRPSEGSKEKDSFDMKSLLGALDDIEVAPRSSKQTVVATSKTQDAVVSKEHSRYREATRGAGDGASYVPPSSYSGATRGEDKPSRYSRRASAEYGNSDPKVYPSSSSNDLSYRMPRREESGYNRGGSRQDGGFSYQDINRGAGDGAFYIPPSSYSGTTRGEDKPTRHSRRAVPGYSRVDFKVHSTPSTNYGLAHQEDMRKIEELGTGAYRNSAATSDAKSALQEGGSSVAFDPLEKGSALKRTLDYSMPQEELVLAVKKPVLLVKEIIEDSSIGKRLSSAHDIDQIEEIVTGVSEDIREEAKQESREIYKVKYNYIQYRDGKKQRIGEVSATEGESVDNHIMPEEDPVDVVRKRLPSAQDIDRGEEIMAGIEEDIREEAKQEARRICKVKDNYIQYLDGKKQRIGEVGATEEILPAGNKKRKVDKSLIR